MTPLSMSVCLSANKDTKETVHTTKPRYKNPVVWSRNYAGPSTLREPFNASRCLRQSSWASCVWLHSELKVIGLGHEKLYSEAFVTLLVAFFLEKWTPSGWRFSQLLKDIHYPNSGSCYMFSNWKALTIGSSWGRFKCIENASPKKQEDSTIYNHALMLHRNTINARILTKHRELHEYDSLK